VIFVSVFLVICIFLCYLITLLIFYIYAVVTTPLTLSYLNESETKKANWMAVGDQVDRKLSIRSIARPVWGWGRGGGRASGDAFRVAS
jgi:hypothetical protein